VCAWLVGRANGAPALNADTQKAIAQAQQVIDGALLFLKAQQQPDGGWTTSPHQPPAITAVVLRAFALEPRYGGKADFVKKGYDKLLSFQLEDGGIYKDLLANYNTAIAISSLAAAGNPQYEARIKKAVEYLKGLQWTDKIQGPKGEVIDQKSTWWGGAGYGSKGRPDGSNTQILIEALRDAGLKPDDPAYQNALKFVTRMQNRSESNDQPWAGNDGGGVYTPANNGESFAGEYLGPDGKRMLRSYGSMTYAMLKSYIYCGLTRDDPRVKAAWEWITRNWTLDENPGMKLGDPANAQHGLYYYYHTLARALAAYGEPVVTDPKGDKHDWRIELIAKLASLQQKDGSFVGDKKWMEDNPVLTTAFVVLSLQEAREDLKARPAK
jgi:squalene-hopene/tetraprenyl-beta-curcumene cyclase